MKTIKLEEWSQLCGLYKQERDEARAALRDWQTLRLWGAEPQHIHVFIKSQQVRVHEAQEIEKTCEQLERERDEARAENKKLREEVEDLKVRYRSAMMDRDSYRFQAEQKFAMRRELEELLGIDDNAPGDEQFKKGLEALKAVVRKAKLYDKKN